MLDAGSVLLGAHLKASNEALVNQRHHEARVELTGDETVCTSVVDIARQILQRRGITARVRGNAFAQRWQDHRIEFELKVAVKRSHYRQALPEAIRKMPAARRSGCRLRIGNLQNVDSK